MLLTIGILALLAFELWRSYGIARLDAERNVANLAHALSEQTARTVQAIDLSLQSVATELANAGDLPDNDPRFLADLRRRLHTLPYVRAIFVVGADGYISHDTDYPATPRVSLADRDYFTAHRDNPSLGLRIGPPLRSRSVGLWFVSLTRRIERADGRFAGVAVVAMEPLYFEKFYRQLLVGGGTIALFLESGTLLARAPTDESIIGTSPEAPFTNLLNGGTRHVSWSRSPVTAVPRVRAYEALEDAPLIMQVTLNEAEAMQPWRSHMIVAMIGAGIIMAMLISMEFFAVRYRRREDQARARLAEGERLESVGRFASGVAHDIGNLLRVLRSSVLLLRQRGPVEPETRDFIDQIDATVAIGDELIRQLLAHSRAGGTHSRIVDINSLLSDALPMLRRAAGPKVEIRASLADSEPRCLIDGARFRAVVLNLVLNARDAMPEGGRISIALDFLPSDRITPVGWIELAVGDEGAGMPAKIRKQVLDPFFTTKSSGEGSGLGLSQVEAFVRDSHGKLDIASEVGKGTTIRIRLPLIDRNTSH